MIFRDRCARDADSIIVVMMMSVLFMFVMFRRLGRLMLSMRTHISIGVVVVFHTPVAVHRAARSQCRHRSGRQYRNQK